MSQFSQVFEGAIADWIKGTVFPVAPTSLTLALSRADPTDDLSGLNEPTDAAYARQAITFGTKVQTVGVGSVITQNNNIIFPTAVESWGTITHGVIYAVGGGLDANGLFFGAFNVPRLVPIGDTFSVASGTITITVR